MPKRPKHPPPAPPPAPGEPPAVPKAMRAYLRAIGRRGGLASGAKRMTNLTPKQRAAIARTAARARWTAAQNRTESEEEP